MQFIKKLMPERLLKFIRPIYHGTVALLASVYFGRPAESLIVIGITGTAGKSTTVAMLAHILNNAELLGNRLQPRNNAAKMYKCGYITTVNYFNGDANFINKHGLSMPGGWLLQKQLKEMVRRGCSYAIVECTSEGLAQNRHLGINFDVALFTNLSHAHLDAHGSFGNYHHAKGRLFTALQQGRKKQQYPEKTIGANIDDPMAGYFLSFPAAKKFGVSFKRVLAPSAQKVFFCKMLESSGPVEFEIQGQNIALHMLGGFNAKNAALAAACAENLGVDLVKSAEALKFFTGVAGRMQSVENGLGVGIIVDYGCEPASIKEALEAAAQLPHNRLIHVFGSTGGHRDVSKRFIFGKTSAQYADQIIVTNDDVYNSDPAEIANNITAGIKSFALRKPQYEIILDRRQAIARALSAAQKGDIILITGKGSEQFLVLPGNKRIEWDEVSIVKELLTKN